MKVSYLYSIPREDVLKLTLHQLFDYSTEAIYWSMEERGVPFKRPLSSDEIEQKKERDALIKARYKKILDKKNKGLNNGK